ncbi:MAG TPA: hypothetical protein VD815_07650 [Candidatus Saccharimonadales bacterium]|nr:hypothetical protein [Candidatus Saccharimonadales bacterium]
MNSIIGVNKAIITSTILAISFILLVGPISMTMNVFATANTANQGIGQSQSSTQLGVCVSGDGTLFSCNNLNAQNQQNSGNNAAAQSGGDDDDDDDDDGGNTANQGIGQAQSSAQNALCVSGTGTFVSCNNLNAQNQQNSGSNALAQQGGSGSGANIANQAIGQAQSSTQNSGVASGGSTTGSGNNVNEQTQNNSGNNAAAQSGGSGSGGNTANQGIGQSQTSNQNSGVVSGGNTAGSGNNVNTQTQNNTGNNAAAQQ